MAFKPSQDDSWADTEILTTRQNDGIRYDLAEGSFGNRGSLTFVFADRIFKAHTTYRVNDGVIDRYLASMNDLSTPSELVVHDICLHKGLVVEGEPQVMLLDRLSASRGL